jgi:UDP-glucose 4-epimerase
MQILITGVAGYIGSICAEALVRAGHSVTGLDNLSTGHRKAVPPEVTFFECDLNDPSGLERVFRSAHIDAVMHFAAASLVGESVEKPSRSYLVNVGYGIFLLDAMVRHGVRGLVLSSSAAVYGEPQFTPITEDHPTHAINPYGRSKRLLENILAEYREWAGLRYVVLRYFNAAGASAERGEDHRNETHVIPILLQAAAGQRKEFRIYGSDYPTPDGSCVRDYVHVLDIADAHMRALKQLDRLSGQIFNLGSSHGYSVKEVIAAAQRITGKSIPVVEGPRRAGDPAVLVASAEKIGREAGWNPQFNDIESMVQSAWDWKQKYPAGYED